MDYSINCYECGKELRNAGGVDLVHDLYSNRDGEDVCQACHDVNTEPYMITSDDGDHVGFHNLDCGSIEVEWIDPQPEIIENSMLPNDVWWLYGDNVYRDFDMQEHLLAEADVNLVGGPVLIDNVWYWSPVFDDEGRVSGTLWSLTQFPQSEVTA